MATFTQAFVDAHQAKLAAKKRVEAQAIIKAVPVTPAIPGIKKPNKPATKQRNGYNTAVVLAYFKEMGLPEPIPEYHFAKEAMGRNWRFDFAWPTVLWTDGRLTHPGLALECQGGIFQKGGGRHNRGAAMLKEWEKLNAAAAMNYRVIYCQPSEICMLETVNLIKRCLGI